MFTGLQSWDTFRIRLYFQQWLIAAVEAMMMEHKYARLQAAVEFPVDEEQRAKYEAFLANEEKRKAQAQREAHLLDRVSLCLAAVNTSIGAPIDTLVPTRLSNGEVHMRFNGDISGGLRNLICTTNPDAQAIFWMDMDNAGLRTDTAISYELKDGVLVITEHRGEKIVNVRHYQDI